MAIGNYRYPHIDFKRTGQNLKRLCDKNGYSVKDIQAAIGIGSNQAVYDWFNGKNLPTLQNFFALSRLLNTSMDDLIIENVPERPQEPEVMSVEIVYMRKNRNYMRAAEYDKLFNEAC